MRMFLCVAWVVCLTLVSVGLATAAGSPTAPLDRAAYVKQLEAICAPGASATKRIVKGVRENVQKGLLGRAAGQFASAARIFGHTVKGIAAVARPSADAATLSQWFVYLNRQEAYLKKVAGALRAGQKVRSQGYLARFIHYGNLGNNVVLSFGFHSCRFDPTRFG